jgi:hypothetical protein
MFINMNLWTKKTIQGFFKKKNLKKILIFIGWTGQNNKL